MKYDHLARLLLAYKDIWSRAEPPAVEEVDRLAQLIATEAAECGLLSANIFARADLCYRNTRYWISRHGLGSPTVAWCENEALKGGVL
ncbi:MAG: hypothetical protein WDZ59_11860 [Pirellulales bacterium]